MKKIAIASDHGGFDLKESIITHLLNTGWEVDDLGPHSADSVDYPDSLHKLLRYRCSQKNSRDCHGSGDLHATNSSPK
ncbi:MAG: RpiB/LacA/LacB family sugar-phosphate isomerase [Nitrospinae bacterium]|nr:RpiB/LacA/LacB family sugar-phosphate isomerase [Nitrospinota bacterium]